VAADLLDRDAPLCDQAAIKPLGDMQPLGYVSDVEQPVLDSFGLHDLCKPRDTVRGDMCHGRFLVRGTCKCVGLGSGSSLASKT
jgi:hypothetical protein